MLIHNLLHLAAACPGQKTGVPGLYNNLCGPGGDVQLQSLSDIYIVIGNVIQLVLSIAGALAVIMIIVGGIFYAISAGDPGRIKRAKDIITQAITGLIIILGAYAGIVFISSKF
jgi:hypothetical protein